MIQLIVAQAYESSIWTEPNQKPGNVVWVKSEQAARHLIEAGLCRWPAPFDEPKAETPAGKFAGDRTDGPSTVSPLLSEHGPEKPASAWEAALVSPVRL